MKDDVIAHPIVDPNLTSYEGFFDHDWSKRMLQATKSSTLDQPLSALLFAWRTTNGAHSLPSVMARTLTESILGSFKGSVQYRAMYSNYVVDGLVEKLEDKMQFNLSIDQRLHLSSVVEQIEREAADALKVAKKQVDRDMGAETSWAMITQEAEFAFCLIGLQRSNYNSLFFAYEEFLQNLVQLREPEYTSKKPIDKALNKHFGESLGSFCWDESVILAKLIRNALAHNGGRVGADLNDFKTRFYPVDGDPRPQLQDDRFAVSKGVIQIVPGNVRFLFALLRERVTRIANELA